jgi:hypothetical protein
VISVLRGGGILLVLDTYGLDKRQGCVESFDEGVISFVYGEWREAFTIVPR